MSVPAQCKILIVDDEESVRETLQLALEVEGYLAISARNGKHALEILRSGEPLPALILCDLMMPEMNGWELLDILQGDPALSRIPVVMITAFDDKPKPPLARELVRKPIGMDDLYSMVKKYCG